MRKKLKGAPKLYGKQFLGAWDKYLSLALWDKHFKYIPYNSR